MTKEQKSSDLVQDSSTIWGNSRWKLQFGEAWKWGSGVQLRQIWHEQERKKRSVESSISFQDLWRLSPTSSLNEEGDTREQRRRRRKKWFQATPFSGDHALGVFLPRCIHQSGRRREPHTKPDRYVPYILYSRVGCLVHTRTHKAGEDVIKKMGESPLMLMYQLHKLGAISMRARLLRWVSESRIFNPTTEFFFVGLLVSIVAIKTLGYKAGSLWSAREELRDKLEPFKAQKPARRTHIYPRVWKKDVANKDWDLTDLA